MKTITTLLRRNLPALAVGTVFGALIGLAADNHLSGGSNAMPTSVYDSKAIQAELGAPTIEDSEILPPVNNGTPYYDPSPVPPHYDYNIAPPSPHEDDRPPFMGWEYWGFNESDALTVSDIVVGGTYCQVNARYGPLETITVTGELTTAGEINPDGSEYTADSNVIPVDDTWLGYIYTGDFGLEPYSSGKLNEVNRTFEGPCPGGETEFERMLDEYEQMIEDQEDATTTV